MKGILYKMSNVMPPDIIKNLYNSSLCFRMNYAISVRGGDNITNINKINSINPFPPSVPIWHRLVKLSILI